MSQPKQVFQEARRYTLDIQRPVAQGLLVQISQEGQSRPITFSDEQTLLQFVARLVRGPGGLR